MYLETLTDVTKSFAKPSKFRLPCSRRTSQVIHPSVVRVAEWKTKIQIIILWIGDPNGTSRTFQLESYWLPLERWCFRVCCGVSGKSGWKQAFGFHNKARLRDKWQRLCRNEARACFLLQFVSAQFTLLRPLSSGGTPFMSCRETPVNSLQGPNLSYTETRLVLNER